MEISGSRVLVTGASRGIGRELARGFAAAGADVAASVRLPRRTAPISCLVDAARRSTWAVAHGLTTPPRPI